MPREPHGPRVESASLGFPSTKIMVPQPRRRLVPRERVVSRFGQPSSRRLVVVQAPAGWGKTTAVLSWRRHGAAGRPFAWVGLDADDSDPSKFWACVVMAVDRALPGRLADAVRLVDSGTTQVEQVLLPSVVNALAECGDQLVLVLDDYHSISSAAVDAQVETLVESMPSTVQVVLISRTRPGLDLARLRAQGEVTELSAEDLRFSAAETTALLSETLGLRLGADHVRALQQRTEGWAAALQLAALSLRAGGDASATIGRFTGHDRNLVDYLGAEVLGRLDPDLRRFLAQTSILRAMTAELCDEVTLRTDSAALLRRIERDNLFVVPLDTSRRWFRYHHLFADVLRLELVTASEDHVRALHRRAATWHAANGFAADALRHALLADDGDLAQRVVAEHWNREYNLGRLATVSGWLDALGDDRVRADPWLSAARVMVWADEGRLDELDAWLELDRELAVDGYPYAIMRALHRFKSGDLARAAADLDRAESLRAPTHQFWPTVELCVRGVTAYWSGDSAAARAALAGAATQARTYANVAGHTYALGYLALIAVQEGEPHVARRRLDEIAALAAGRSDLDAHFVMTLPRLTDGLISLNEERLEAAAAALDRALVLARSGAGRLELIAALVASGRTAARLGDRVRSRALLAEAAVLLASCREPGRARTLLADEPGVPRPRIPATGERLTAREAAVLRLLPSTKSLRQIADELFVSHNTVKTHSRTLYRKLDVTNREEAVRRARGRGLL